MTLGPKCSLNQHSPQACATLVFISINLIRAHRADCDPLSLTRRVVVASPSRRPSYNRGIPRIGPLSHTSLPRATGTHALSGDGPAVPLRVPESQLHQIDMLPPGRDLCSTGRRLFYLASLQ